MSAGASPSVVKRLASTTRDLAAMEGLLVVVRRTMATTAKSTSGNVGKVCAGTIVSSAPELPERLSRLAILLHAELVLLKVVATEAFRLWS